MWLIRVSNVPLIVVNSNVEQWLVLVMVCNYGYMINYG